MCLEKNKVSYNLVVGTTKEVYNLDTYKTKGLHTTIRFSVFLAYTGLVCTTALTPKLKSSLFSSRFNPLL